MRLIREALRNLTKKPFTQKYPKEKVKIPENYRGKHIHFREKCIYCGICARYCPTGAITVNLKNKKWSVDLGKCIFCSLCEYVCHTIPKKDAIKLGKEFELANEKKEFVC